ncbi:hypothetical protein CN311_05760 [Mesorhizobium sanjuanii]|uniref:Secreted protein n=1 Tax=Mesorhizobium sanjuanii TaxID=2037900 RepID=A0A2A6FK47_9HYPH|nr:hypothetical protein CN311_05760 [Mesorhizobium sanjuanii]
MKRRGNPRLFCFAGTILLYRAASATLPIGLVPRRHARRRLFKRKDVRQVNGKLFASTRSTRSSRPWWSEHDRHAFDPDTSRGRLRDRKGGLRLTPIWRLAASRFNARSPRAD